MCFDILMIEQNPVDCSMLDMVVNGVLHRWGKLSVECCNPCDPTPFTFYPSAVDNQDLPALGRITSIAPNPFNPKTEIHLAVASDSRVELVIFDMRGHTVATLVDEALVAGSYVFTWHGFDTVGRQISNGVFFVRLKIDGAYTQVEKVSMIK